jgi:hypothetical protein
MGTVQFGAGTAATDLTFATSGANSTDLVIGVADGGSVTVGGTGPPR